MAITIVRNRPFGHGGWAKTELIHAQAFAPAAANAVDHHFFIADQRYRVIECRFSFSAAGGAGAQAVLRRCQGTEAPASGDSLGTISLTGTPNRGTNLTLTTSEALLELAEGDRLALDFGGTLTGLTSLGVTVALVPLNHVAYFVSP